MVDVGKLIRIWRLHHRLTQEALADRAGIAGNSVGGYERGESDPSFHQLQRIANALSLTLPVFFTGPQPQPQRERELVPVPFSEQWSGTMRDSLPPSWPVSQALLPHNACIVTRIRSDAMQPHLLDGDLVLVEPRAAGFSSGDLVIVSCREEILVRRLLRIRKARILEAFNRSYPEVKIGEEHRLLGRILAVVERRLLPAAT